MIPVLVTGARGQLGDAIRRRIYRHPMILMRNGRRGMTFTQKLRIMLPVTTLMGISFLLSSHPHARIAIGVMWAAHIIFLLFRVPTKK